MRILLGALLLASLVLVGAPMLMARSASSTATEHARAVPARPPSATAPRPCAPTPPGSYRRTCRNIRVACDGSSMTAECRTRSGAWVGTSLGKPFDCFGDIANIDGDLECSF